MDLRQLESISPSSGRSDTHDQLKTYIYERANRTYVAGDNARDQIANIQQLEEYRIVMRENFIKSIGGLPSSDFPLQAEIKGGQQFDGFRIENIIFQSRPEVYITSNLYVPDGITSPRAAVLFLCGHSIKSKQDPEYVNVCLYLVQAGLVVLSLDAISGGERVAYYYPETKKSALGKTSDEHNHSGVQCLMTGKNIARYFLHDAMRGIDYLCTRPEVDSSNIGVTGNSGGGTQTCMMMLCDPRVVAAAPSCYPTNRKSIMYTGKSSDLEHIWNGMGVYGFDHEDFFLAMAPKPVVILAAMYDSVPIEGTQRTYERSLRFWDMYGVPDNLELFVEHTVHSYSEAMARKATEFLSLHLLGKCSTLPEKITTKLKLDTLNCTASGQVCLDYPNSRFVFDENCLVLEQMERARNQLISAEHMNRAFDWLKSKVFQGRWGCNTNMKIFKEVHLLDLSVKSLYWSSQEGIINHGILIKHCTKGWEEVPITVAVWDEGTDQIQQHYEWISDTCRSGRAVLVLDVTGVGDLKPNTTTGADPKSLRGIMAKLNGDLMWMDDSLAALRVYDVIRTLDMIEEQPIFRKDDIQAYAYGREGIYAQLAAFLDKRIKYIEFNNTLKSFSELARERYYNTYRCLWLIIPGMLEYFDIPDLS